MAQRGGLLILEPSLVGLHDNCSVLKITGQVPVLSREDLKVQCLKMSNSFTQICVGICGDVGYLKKRKAFLIFLLLSSKKRKNSPLPTVKWVLRPTVSACRHRDTSLLFIIDSLALLKTTRGSSKSKDGPESRKSKIATDRAMCVISLAPGKLRARRHF